MIYLELFWTFLQIGTFSFGGGYGMISLIRERCLAYGWLSEEELLNIIAVAESTPGPIAVNLATFVGAEQGGILGSLIATLGIVIPSFVIILLIASLLRNLTKYAGVKAFLNGIRPCVVGLILATALILFLSACLGISALGGEAAVNWRALVILAMLVALSNLFKRMTKKKPSPIFMILISAVLGMVLYGI